MAKKDTITSSSSAEYFSKNLQQVGFSSYTKAALTTVKEAVDNSLDACEDAGILPEISVEVTKVGDGSVKSADTIRVRVVDNGPGLVPEDAVKVFGEYLASSKFGRGRCSRGQQGIGISAATTWAQLTHAKGALVITKTAKMRQAVKCLIEVDIKQNKGILQSKETVDWDRDHGLSCEFVIDARVQVQGEGGLLAYLNGTALVNPHATIRHKILENDWVEIPRLQEELPTVPEPTDPHPHTMKLGEFIAHSHLFGRIKCGAWLKNGFSRVSDATLKELLGEGVKTSMFEKLLPQLSQEEFKKIFMAMQKLKLMAPSTKSVMGIGEKGLAMSIQRMGRVDFFAVVSRKPAICDFKPVLVEVAVARFLDKNSNEGEEPATIMRFANRVPLQFDKSGCAMTKAISSINWRTYGINQPKNSLPLGPYVVAVSVVSPFIKFKNASKETVDASDELVNELRLALIQAGQRLSKHIKREQKESDLIKKREHIEQFAPILVDGACRIVKAKKGRREKALEGLAKILAKDTHMAEKELHQAIQHSEAQMEKLAHITGILPIADEGDDEAAGLKDLDIQNEENSSDETLQLTLEGVPAKPVRKSKKENKKGTKKAKK